LLWETHDQLVYLPIGGTLALDGFDRPFVGKGGGVQVWQLKELTGGAHITSIYTPLGVELPDWATVWDGLLDAGARLGWSATYMCRPIGLQHDEVVGASQ